MWESSDFQQDLGVTVGEHLDVGSRVKLWQEVYLVFEHVSVSIVSEPALLRLLIHSTVCAALTALFSQEV